jgi:hypothetical protein
MGGMTTRAETMASATDIISLGLAKDEDSVVRLATLVGKLGWDMNQVILTFANQSTMRLDQLGLSVTDVTSKWNQFKAAGMESTAAFNLAVIEAGENKLKLLGDTVETKAGSFKRFEAAIGDVTDKIKSYFTPTLADAAEGAALMLTWNDKLAAIQKEHAAQIVKTADGYDDYIAEIQRAYEVTGKHVDAQGRLIESYMNADRRAVTYIGAQVALTREQFEATKAAQALSSGVKDANEAFGKATYGSVAWAASLKATGESADQAKAAVDAFAKIADVYNRSSAYAIQLADSNQKLADKEKELADLNREIIQQGPARTKIDEDKTLNANELALAQARRKVITEDLNSAKKREGETDAEFNLRVIEMKNQIGDLSGKMGEHTIVVGGATKEQLAHRDALLADIEAMKAQTKEAEGREMIKALDARKLGAEAYTKAVAQINEVYDLFTDQELKAATSHTLLITALSDAEGLSAAQQAIIDYYKSIGDAYGALMALIAAGQNVTGNYAGGHAENLLTPKPSEGRPREYQMGGIVPGPAGGRQLAVVHGGEQIVPAGQSTRTWNITVQDTKAMAMIMAQAEREQRQESARTM